MPGKPIHVIRMPWDGLQGSTKRVYRVSILEAMKQFLELLAPGQSTDIWKYISNFPIDAQDPPINTDVPIHLSKVMVTSIQEAPTPILRNQILSLVAKEYKKSELMNAVPGLTIGEIDMARKHALVYGPGVLPATEPTPREVLSMDKAEHFITFMMQPQYLQVNVSNQVVIDISKS